MSHTDSEALRTEPRTYGAIIKGVLKDPPAWLTWGWFVVALWMCVFGFAVITHSHTPVHLGALQMVADINGFESFGQLVESHSAFGWGGFVVGLSFHLIYVVDHVRRVLQGEA